MMFDGEMRVKNYFPLSTDNNAQGSSELNIPTFVKNIW